MEAINSYELFLILQYCKRNALLSQVGIERINKYWWVAVRLEDLWWNSHNSVLYNFHAQAVPLECIRWADSHPGALHLATS